MRAERLGPQHDAEVTAFLDALGRSQDGPSVLAYHYPFYRDLVLSALGQEAESAWFGVRGASGEVTAVLPGIFRSTDAGGCYNSLPFFGPNAGVLASTENLDEYARWSLALTREAIEFASGRGALSAVFYSRFLPVERGGVEPSLESWTTQLGLAGDQVVSIPKQTLYLSLESPPREWPAKIRYDLRRTLAAGVRIIDRLSPSQVDRMIDMHLETCAQCGAPPKPSSVVRRLLEGDERVGAWAATKDDQLIGALMVLWGPQTASYYLPCCDAQARGLQPITLLIDHAIDAARNRGIRYWNFESSPVREGGVWSFKKKWGAVEGAYRTTVVRLRSLAVLRSLGRERLSQAFPYFFVYPHALLA